MISIRMSRLGRRAAVMAGSGLLLGASVGLGSAQPVAAVAGDVFVSPSGSDSNPGTQSQPVQTLQKAQQLVRSMNSSMSSDITVVLEDGFYRMSAPLTLEPSDSGTNGHNVVWTADSGARPVVAGSDQITGWSLFDSARNIWVAQGPSGIQTRQLYVNGARAQRASGPVPVSLTMNTNGFTASAATMAGWRDPSGQPPSEVEFVFHGGLGAWTEPRCPIASMSGTTITMIQPCWINSTQRIKDPRYLRMGVPRTVNFVGPATVGNPTSVENAYQLLTQPGQWYLDTHSSKFYYMPKAGESMAAADVEAPALESLVTGAGNASNPIHNIVFNGIQFSYATWMGASGPNGLSEIQANYQVTGPHGWDQQGLCTFSNPTGTCPYASWTQIAANVSLTYDQNIQFTSDSFIHLGAAGLGLGDGSQNDLVKGNVVTDTSGNGIELGNVDMPLATGADQTLNNTIQDNYVFDTPVEFRGGIGIDVGYSAHTTIEHNQIDHTPYTAISNGWGGWPDKVAHPGQANFSNSNTISNNLAFNFLESLNDGGATYNNGIQGTSYATGEHIVNNVFHDDMGTTAGAGHIVYTDNGAAWITISGNCVYNTNGHSAEGSNHTNYYPGVPGTTDPISIGTNYFVTSASACPASLIASAGLEPAYQGLLSWQQAPNPPVGGGPHCSPTMDPPSGVSATANGAGSITVSWSAPAPDCHGPATAYAIWGYSAASLSGTMQESLTTSVTFSGLTPNSYYIFTTIAFDGSQWSNGWSNWSAWTLAT